MLTDKLMANPSVSYPDWMDQEIERRKPRGMPKSYYIREALIARFNDEDADNWRQPEWKEPTEYAGEENTENVEVPAGSDDGAATDGGQDGTNGGDAK